MSTPIVKLNPPQMPPLEEGPNGGASSPRRVAVQFSPRQPPLFLGAVERGKGRTKAKIPRKRALILLAIYFLVVCVKSALSFLAAWVFSGPLIAAAAKERGYGGAYGGEWAIILGVFVLSYYLATKGFNSLVASKKLKKFLKNL